MSLLIIWISLNSVFCVVTNRFGVVEKRIQKKTKSFFDGQGGENLQKNRTFGCDAGAALGYIEMRSGEDLGNAEVDQELGASGPLGIVHGGRGHPLAVFRVFS